MIYDTVCIYDINDLYLYKYSSPLVLLTSSSLTVVTDPVGTAAKPTCPKIPHRQKPGLRKAGGKLEGGLVHPWKRKKSLAPNYDFAGSVVDLWGCNV